MKLSEAIQHAEEKGKPDTPCGAEHRQLAGWLKELKRRRAADQRLAFNLMGTPRHVRERVGEDDS